LGKTCVTAAALAGAVACASQPGVQAPDANLPCLSLTGAGETVGDRHRLKGSAIFNFEGEERTVQVGLYLFDMTPTSVGGLLVDTQYQFNLGNGDSFLTRDDVHFDPTLESGTYNFNVPLTIFDASGMFSHLVNKRPVALSAEITFGPPRNLGDAQSAVEFFEVSGRICE